VELGHHLPTDHCVRCVAVPLSGDRRLESQDRRLGCRQTGRCSHRGRSGEQGLPERTDQQGEKAAVDPPRRQRQCHAWCHAGEAVGGTGRAQIVLQAARQQRQPVLGIAVHDGEVPA